MRYFNYGSMQDEAVRDAHYIVEVQGIGGRKLGTLKKKLGDPGFPDRASISQVQTTIKQGAWGQVAQPTPAEKKANAKPGKVAGLLCVDERDVYSEPKTYWYQIGVDHNGKAFAELGWKTRWKAGAMLKTYDGITITDDMVLKMVPKGDTVEFHFGSYVKKLTWDPKSQDWNAGDRAPEFRDNKYNYWNDMSKIVSIDLQIEAYWSSSSASAKGNKMELPGTAIDPFVFGPTEYESKTLGTQTIYADQLTSESSDPNFKHSLKKGKAKSTKVKLWSKANRKREESN